MMLALGALIAGGIALPHILGLRRAAPLTGAVLWGCSLALRALAALFLALHVVFFLPATELFGALTHWCVHVVVPIVAAHLGFGGDSLDSAAIVLPGVLLAGSVASAVHGVAQAASTVRRFLTRGAVAGGPPGTLVVGGPGVLVAAAGLARPRLVVSTDALAQLDADELAAGLAHERGHIVRRHRYVLVAAELCRAVGRIVPGSRRAIDELGFHLERDADRWALRHHHDGLALASAICKAATTRTTVSPALAALGGGLVTERLDQLTGAVPPVHRRRARFVNGLAGGMVFVTLTAALAVPGTVQAGINTSQKVERAQHCAT